jgi:chromosomal replication initiator protein
MAGEAENSASPNGLAREFVTGPENRLAAATIERLLTPNDEPAFDESTVASDDESSYLFSRNQSLSPVIFYGPPGTGKSHLVHGLVEAWKHLRPDDSVVLITAAEFAQQYADAVDKRAVGRWRSRFRSADLFVLEDLAHLSTKLAAQSELLHTIDSLADRDSLVIVTSRLPPHELPTLLAGLQSRLLAGLSVPLVLPEADARRQILSRLCEVRKLSLSETSLRLLARSLVLPAPELSGVLANLEHAARTTGRALDDSFVRAYVRQRAAARQPPLRAIATHTSRHFALRVSDLRSPSRRRGVVQARDVAMYLARQLTSKSLKQIGEYFGGRDHTTVLHGCRKTERLMHSDSATLDAIVALRQSLATG